MGTLFGTIFGRFLDLQKGHVGAPFWTILGVRFGHFFDLLGVRFLNLFDLLGGRFGLSGASGLST